MKDFNNNSNSYREQGESVYQFNAKDTVETIQNVSKNIKEYSSQMRETMKTLRQSGVIPEMAEAIRMGSFAVRDTVKDINETTKELKAKGVVVDTAGAVENTWKSVGESISTVKELSSDAGKASPTTSRAVQNGAETVKKQTNQVTNKVMETIKNKVVAK